MSESEEIKISTIHTSCKDCAFAKYEDHTQVDCLLDLVEKYKKAGTQIVNAYDDDKEFFIVNNRKCIGYRTNQWFDNRVDQSISSVEEKIDYIHKTFKVNYILLIDLKELDLSGLTKIFNNIKTLDIPPAKIILLRHSYIDNKSFDFDIVYDLLKDTNIRCPWRIQTMLTEDVSLRSTISTTVSNNPANKFILYVSHHTDTLNSIVNEANKIIFDELSSFIVLSNQDYTAKMFLGLMYRYVWHSAGVNILEKNDDFRIIL